MERVPKIFREIYMSGKRKIELQSDKYFKNEKIDASEFEGLFFKYYQKTPFRNKR